MPKLGAIVLHCTAGLLAALAAGEAAARTVLDLQKDRVARWTRMTDSKVDAGSVQLVQPNKRVENWYLLHVRWPGQPRAQVYHLENAAPDRVKVRLEGNGAPQLILTEETSDKGRHTCSPWSGGPTEAPIAKARRRPKPFVSLCDGALFLRNPTKGDVTTTEWAVDFLRSRVDGGEDAINMVKDTLYKDKFLVSAELDGKPDLSAQGTTKPGTGPIAARLAPAYKGVPMRPGVLGIRRAKGQGRMLVGSWYPSALAPQAVYVSTFFADAAPEDILKSHPNRVLPLNPVEKRAVVYLVAFDLAKYDVGFALGTDHPELTYSERTARKLKRKGWKGPDGFTTTAPFVSTGLVSPSEADKIAAVFTGGFKRRHSVFRVGQRGNTNGGHHYGFLSHGVVFSSLWPGLSTAAVDTDGKFTMKTWTQADGTAPARYRFARQNGVPLVERDPATGATVPGALVSNNFSGNWSGDKNNNVRTLRAGACWQQIDGREYLVYGYFSSHTPKAMARVFQAYECRHAMHLDMNMVGHVYLAIHARDRKSGEWRSEYLTKEMNTRDTFMKGERLHRFVGTPDNRDFFYLTTKRPQEPPAKPELAALLPQLIVPEPQEPDLPEVHEPATFADWAWGLIGL